MRARVIALLWLVSVVVVVFAARLTFARASASPALVQTTALMPVPATELTATAPRINYQGRLLDALSGQPKPDGAYNLAFRLYTVESGGSALWSESKSIPVNKGLFATLLGDTTPLDLAIFNGQDLYLGITVGTDPEATPRQLIAHVAYAIFAQSAGNAALLNGNAASAFAPAGHNHDGSTIVDGSLTEADLAPGVIPKFISLDPYAAYLEGTAYRDDGFGQYSGLYLPKGTTYASFAVGFTIPPNYTTGTPLTMRIIWHTASTNCQLELRGNSISVAQAGGPHIVGQTTVDGIVIRGGETLSAPAIANRSNELLVELRSPDGVTPLEAGDSVITSLYRPGSGANDTCSNPMVIQAISITYK